MKLSQIRDFLAVAQSGSLRSAARLVGVSQPAITKSIRRLEQELHIQLLQRNARGASITAAGKAFLARARVVQTELAKVQDDLHALRGGAEGSVAFGIAPQTCVLIVPDAVRVFRRQFPDARLRIIEGVNTALLPQVRDETLDFTIGQKPTARLDPALRFRALFRPELVVAARIGHPLGASRSLRELKDAEWLMFYSPGTGAMLEVAFAAADLPFPRNVIRCESYATALALVARTDTLGLVIPQLLAEPLAQKFIRRIPIAETIPAPMVGMYARSDAPLTPAAAAMAQAVTATARRLARRG
jgi:LysR family transcriptional regulator of abg operon